MVREVDDFEIRPPDEDLQLPHVKEHDGRWAILIVVALLVVALVGGGYLLYRLLFADSALPPPPPPVAEPQADPPAPAPELEPPPPPQPTPTVTGLDDSDPLVRALVSGVSSHPRLTSWLVSDDLVRRFARSVVNVAYDESPIAHLEFLRPQGEFGVVDRGAWLRVDPRSYRRYDLLADIFLSLDVEGCVELYRELQPLIDQAYAELGYPERRFETVLARAIDKLLLVPVVEADVAVVPRVITYEFADPGLEGLSAAQKQLLRMGPRNVERVQSKLRTLAQALDLT